MSAFAYIADMETREPLLDASVSFRASQKMVESIEVYRRMRRLPKTADAARELMASATADVALLNAAIEARALGLDPVGLIREQIAALPAAPLVSSPEAAA